MSTCTYIAQAAAYVRHLRHTGRHAQARKHAFDARRAIGCYQLLKSVAS
jgi:hypothetical protein